MTTTMMGVIIVITILILLIILVLKMTKKYHITWYWCQDIRDSYMVGKGPTNSGKGSPPLFGQCPKENVFFLPVRCSLMDSADSWFMITQNLQIFQGRCWAFKDCQNSSLLVKSFHGDLVLHTKQWLFNSNTELTRQWYWPEIVTKDDAHQNGDTQY